MHDMIHYSLSCRKLLYKEQQPGALLQLSLTQAVIGLTIGFCFKVHARTCLLSMLTRNKPEDNNFLNLERAINTSLSSADCRCLLKISIDVIYIKKIH